MVNITSEPEPDHVRDAVHAAPAPPTLIETKGFSVHVPGSQKSECIARKIEPCTGKPNFNTIL
jgi:hypothetical protein